MILERDFTCVKAPQKACGSASFYAKVGDGRWVYGNEGVVIPTWLGSDFVSVQATSRFLATLE
jgi:hypothetical protein